jgi:hypothetical protein
MAGRGKFFELLDIVKFARPNIVTLQPSPTALLLTERLGGGGFMSYGSLYSRIRFIVSGLATDQFIQDEFSFYEDDWKNKSLQAAFTLLRDHMDSKGNWYPISTTASYILGFWFKPSIKGFWYHDEQTYAVLINARKGQPLDQNAVRFLARGVYELHCIDNPNNPIPFIIDLSQHAEDKERKARIYPVSVEEAISLEAFEQTVRDFLVALNQAGISLPPPPEVEHILDLFRRP